MPRQVRPIRVCGDVAYVTLTQGHEAIIDAADVPLVQGYNWHCHVSNNVVYARAVRIGHKRCKFYLHRLIMGEPHGLEIDHIDRDGLNNRRENLRVSTPSQNSQNSRKNSLNTSGFKGVFFQKGLGKWRAQIKTNGKRKSLGCFLSPEEAHEAYCRASDKYHGEFGRTE